jgi:hypothetical protein
MNPEANFRRGNQLSYKPLPDTILKLNLQALLHAKLLIQKPGNNRKWGPLS